VNHFTKKSTEVEQEVCCLCVGLVVSLADDLTALAAEIMELTFKNGR